MQCIHIHVRGEALIIINFILLLLLLLLFDRYLIYGVKNGKHLLIKRANLDGSDDTELYKSQTTADQIYGSPESLTVDDNRVYWVDSKNLRLESILINGR